MQGAVEEEILREIGLEIGWKIGMKALKKSVEEIAKIIKRIRERGGAEIILNYYPYNKAYYDDVREIIDKIFMEEHLIQIQENVYFNENRGVVISIYISLLFEALKFTDEIIDEYDEEEWPNELSLEEIASRVYGIKVHAYTDFKKIWEVYEFFLKIYDLLNKRYKDDDHRIILTFYNARKLFEKLKKLVDDRGEIELIDNKINIILKVHDSDIIKDIYKNITSWWKRKWYF